MKNINRAIRRIWSAGSRLQGKAEALALRKIRPNRSKIDLRAHNSGRSVSSYRAYHYYYWCYHHKVPEKLRAHRSYFSTDGRGFGEDAFHAFWWDVFQQRRPRTCIEIGVFRGQTISLWALCAELLGYHAAITGISPFSSSGDAVSLYPEIDYLCDIQKSFSNLNLPVANLVKCYSTESLAEKTFALGDWDLIYIDGSHDYDVVRADLRLALKSSGPDTLIVMDDSSASPSTRLPKFAFPGHPGPSRVADELLDDGLVSEVVQVGHLRAFQLKS